MIFTIRIFAWLMLLAGVSLIYDPKFIIGLIETNMESTGLYVTAIVLRLLIGILFILTAENSKFPRVLKVLGYLFVLAAVILLIAGRDDFQHFISYLIPGLNPYARISGLLALAFGAFLLYAYARRKSFKKQ